LECYAYDFIYTSEALEVVSPDTHGRNVARR